MGAIMDVATNATARQAAYANACKGRTADQKAVIGYFYEVKSGCGCLGKMMTDAEYDAKVQAIAKGTDFKQRALNKIGLDESQVSEIEPIHFEGYFFDEKKTYAKLGKDNVWRSSAYQISWIFFSDTQVYAYTYLFNMDEDGKKEKTEEWFYKDITNFSASSETYEKIVPFRTTGCKAILGALSGKDVQLVRKNVDVNQFAIVVPGDKFWCAMEDSEYTETSIQGMKAKLREKKM